MPAVTDANLIVGTDTRDDAAVYRLDDKTALVCTTDFFTPVVDDPYDFGRIAAANALSDVYAMGARPLLALNLVGFPARELGMHVLGRILEGGAAVTQLAGVPLVGGHSIDDREPKYGLVVVGLVAPDQVITNAGARPGDRLLLTKPLGSGIVATAIKRGLASAAEIAEITEIMARLNRAAAEVFISHRDAVHGLTDVTGYGLLGHLWEMCEGAGLAARLRADAIPILAAAQRHAAAGVIPGGTRANLKSLTGKVRFHGRLAEDETLQLLLADAQTSGGLLAAVSPGQADALMAALRSAGTHVSVEIGEMVAGAPAIDVLP